ncbi:radical SAM protein [Tissierella creatinini]|nr:radical SAM protein [Tissierella creatinini]TJX69179.1 radical SAM protein [Soehngenia saccharolytica]
MSKHYIIPIFVPHFGCQNDCVFCNQKKITGLSTNVKVEDVESIILTYLNYFAEGGFIEVAFYGGSFTAIDINVQKELLKVPFEYKKKGIINEIRLSTRPDAINKEILNNLRLCGVDTIELGVQSLDEDVLKASDRGHLASIVYQACELIKQFGFNLGLQMMLGLPEDSIEKSLKTCLEFIKLKPYCVRIYPTLVIRDTHLERLYINKSYIPLDLDSAVEQSSLLLMLFYLNYINVIRIGLQPTEDIQLGREVVAGPFHPAFRQLVESNIYRMLFEYIFLERDISTENVDLVIEANKSKISFIAGQQSSNINYWKDKYRFSKIKIYEKDIISNSINITIGKYYDRINMYELMDKYIKNHPLIEKIQGFQQ